MNTFYAIREINGFLRKSYEYVVLVPTTPPMVISARFSNWSSAMKVGHEVATVHAHLHDGKAINIKIEELEAHPAYEVKK